MAHLPRCRSKRPGKHSVFVLGRDLQEGDLSIKFVDAG